MLFGSLQRVNVESLGQGEDSLCQRQTSIVLKCITYENAINTSACYGRESLKCVSPSVCVTHHMSLLAVFGYAASFIKMIRCA